MDRRWGDCHPVPVEMSHSSERAAWRCSREALAQTSACFGAGVGVGVGARQIHLQIGG